MRQSIVTGTLVVFGLMLADTGVADSLMEERFRDEGRQLDLTGFLQPENDARSRSFLYGTPQEHDFSVDTAGTYLFESHVPGGRSTDYRVEAVLLDEEGSEIARGEGLGQSGGLKLRARLEPGDYVLRVEGRKFSTRGKGGDSYYITVAGFDDQGRKLADSLDKGGGIVFGEPGRDGRRTAFVSSENAVAAIAAPSNSEPGTSSSTSGEATPSVAASSATDNAESAEKIFDEIVTDVKIRARGEVLTFDVREAGTIAITTSTYPAGYENTYRIELEVLDEGGSVVAEGAGEGANGNVDLRTQLSPGRYRIRVQGQQFGSAMNSVNNYELKVVQTDRQ